MNLRGTAIRIDKKGLLLARIFSIAFGLAFAKAIYDGGFHYHAMGYEKGYTIDSAPLKFYLSLGWYFLLFIISTYFGFFAKRADSE